MSLERPGEVHAEAADQLCKTHLVWLTPENRCPLCEGDQPLPKRVARVCLFTDLVGSTDLKRRLGDILAAKAIQRHNALFRECLKRFGGREESNRGDGFFATFDLPSSAVSCALAFQQGLARLEGQERLYSRVGINIGEIPQLEEPDSDSSALLSSEVDAAARITELAEEGQILMTRSAFDLARPVLTAGPEGEQLEWKAHGPYELKGLEEPREIFEVGIPGLSPLRHPAGSADARRVYTPGVGETLGWRPAVGLDIPGRPGWRLEMKLGEGGFGEVWLGVRAELKQRRAFKFCFEAERVRMLRREAKILKLLGESLGERDDIAKVIEWRVKEPPYFLESEFASEGSLVEWADSQGGLLKIPLADRLEIVAQTADALAAAHSVGVLHRDIKPSNILISIQAARPRIRLADFGIGAILNRELIDKAGMSQAGFTRSHLDAPGSSGSGTYRYMDPEVLGGRPATIFSDIYSLGVVLYQVVVGDFTRALGYGWEHNVDDELLREDISSCVIVHERRLASAATLSRNLRTLAQRRIERESARRQAAEEEAARKRVLRQRQRLRYWGAVVAAVVAAGGVVALRHQGMALEALNDAVIRKTQLITAHWVADVVDRELLQTEIAARQTAADPRILSCFDGEKSADCQQFLKGALAEHQGSAIRSFSLSDANGIMSAREPRDETLIGRCFLDREWFNGGLSRCRGTSTACMDPAARASCAPIRSIHVSAPFLSRAQDGARVFTVSAPVRPPAGGDPVGVLAVSRDVIQLRKRISRTSGLREGLPLDIILINDRDQVVVHPNLELGSGEPVRWPDSTSLRSAEDGTRADLFDPIDQRPHPSSHKRVGDRGWVVIVRTPQWDATRRALRSEFRDELAHLGESSWILGSLAVLGAGTCLVLLARAVQRRNPLGPGRG